MQKLRHALFLKLLAHDPSSCPPFFLLMYFCRSGVLPVPFPLATFCCVQGLLLCQDQVLPAGVGAAGPGMLCACPASRTAEWCLIHTYIHLFSMAGGGGKSDNIRICKTVLKKKGKIISQSFTSPVGSVNLSALPGL